MSPPKKKTLGTRKRRSLKNPKATTPKQTITSRKLATMTIDKDGVGEDQVLGSNSQCKDSNVDTLIALNEEMNQKLYKLAKNKLNYVCLQNVVFKLG